MKNKWSYNGLTDLFTLWSIDEEGKHIKIICTFRAIKWAFTGILPYCINDMVDYNGQCNERSYFDGTGTLVQ